MTQRKNMKPKRLHPVTSDCRRTFDIRDISRAGGFRRWLDFPLMGIRSSRDYVEIYSTIDCTRPPQIILIEWRRITFCLKPFFNCPQCSRRAVILYSDSLRSYCRHCAGLWFPSQRQRRRTRLKLKARKIRAALDNYGAPGDKLPTRRYRQARKTYHRQIAKLMQIEREPMSKVAQRHSSSYRDRERDSDGKFIAAEQVTDYDD